MSFITQRGSRSRGSIIGFPSELLLMIFKNVHDEVVEQRDWAHDDGPKWIERDSGFYFSPFPYNCAAVSKVWSAVIAMEPTFWTNIVIFIDSDNFSLASISSHLSCSKQLPIDVTVTKKAPELLPVSEAHENRRLQAIADIIRPHIHRCLSLHYKVTYTSSLPRISTHFRGTFPLLDDLRLEASKSSETIQTPAEAAWDIQCPSLVCLALDGLNFMDVFINARHLLDEVQHKWELPSKIAISHLRQPPNSPNRLSFENVWPFIYQTHTLHLEDLDLDYDDEYMLEEPNLDYPEVTLVDLSGSITSTVLSFYNWTESTVINKCCLDNLFCIPFSSDLRLENIDDVENLSRLLRQWDGNNLHIKSCPSFNDTVLKAIGKAGDPTQILFNFSIVNCSNFSPTVLRHTIQDRVEAGAEKPYSIRGRRVPAMMGQDKEWFSSNEIRLSWIE